MSFNPDELDELILGANKYRIQKFDQPGLLQDRAIRVQGGRAKVYRLLDEADKAFALKVMDAPNMRQQWLVYNKPLLKQLATVPGFEACKQMYFVGEAHQDLLREYPELEYANLMPWVDASVWSDIVTDQDALEAETSWQLAYHFAATVTLLERNKIAHCDLSGGNVLVDINKHSVELIDFDEVYWPDAPPPVVTPTGTPGYRKDDRSQWCGEGDRFAAAVLLAEILGWRDKTVRVSSSGNTYFSAKLNQPEDEDRYRLLQDFLSHLQPQLGDLFKRAWQASSLTDCPTMAEWRQALSYGPDYKTTSLTIWDNAAIDLAQVQEEIKLIKSGKDKKWPDSGRTHGGDKVSIETGGVFQPTGVHIRQARDHNRGDIPHTVSTISNSQVSDIPEPPVIDITPIGSYTQQPSNRTKWTMIIVALLVLAALIIVLIFLW